MIRIPKLACPTAILTVLILCSSPAPAQQEFDKTVKEVNKKMVKLFGLGGLKGLPAYGTGLVISPEGHVLTVSGYLIEDPKYLRAHLADGRQCSKIKVLAVEPELDIALLKIEDAPGKLEYFDIAEAAKRPQSQTGDWVLAFSNQFEIAMRSEPMTVQRGAVSSFSKLRARKGVTEAPFNGDVYVVDAITNNPGAGGGALTTRKGELIGIVGKEMRNTLTDTWINYAMPLTAKVEIADDPKMPDKKRTISLLEFIELGKKGDYKTIIKIVSEGGAGGFHGIVMVPDPEGVAYTPAYIEEVRSNSPAAKIGLKSDDLIVYVNGERVLGVKMFKEIMSKTKPGDELTVEVKRGTAVKNYVIKLDEHPKLVAPK